MRRKLSSQMTFLLKFIFPVIWVPFFGLSTFWIVIVGLQDTQVLLPALGFVFAWIAGSAFLYWSCIRLKEVSVNDRQLYVSNYRKEITIPLTEISDVTENVWLNIHPVTIHLSSPSEFGSKIVFMPTYRYFVFFGSHPVVDELKKISGLTSCS